MESPVRSRPRRNASKGCSTRCPLWPEVRKTSQTRDKEMAPKSSAPLASSGPQHQPAVPTPNELRTRTLLEVLEKPISMNFPNETPLTDVLFYIRTATISPVFPKGIPDHCRPGWPPRGRSNDDLASPGRSRKRATENIPEADAQATWPYVYRSGRCHDDHVRVRRGIFERC